jgi:hypothetical protein
MPKKPTTEKRKPAPDLVHAVAKDLAKGRKKPATKPPSTKRRAEGRVLKDEQDDPLPYKKPAPKKDASKQKRSAKNAPRGSVKRARK